MYVRLRLSRTCQGMPIAATAVCASCQAASCKYTCPYCTATTCSLPCFRQHKATLACEQARVAFEAGATKGVGPSLLARERGDVARFVPMKDYDYNQMLDDYQFLNQVGRVVTSTGRSLSEAHMLPLDHVPRPGVRRGPASQQRRDALAKQLGFHKLPIMLLPDGMTHRRMNRTHWDAKYVTHSHTGNDAWCSLSRSSFLATVSNRIRIFRASPKAYLSMASHRRPCYRHGS